MSEAARTINLMKDAPEDIRAAVQQLSFGYKAQDKKSAPEQSEQTGQEAPSAVTTAEVSEPLRRIEAILFAAEEPVSAEDLSEVVPQSTDVAAILMELQHSYAGRGVHLVEVAGKWRFQTAADLDFLFVEEREEQKKLSQAALETLAIIAYSQPVTRAEIEDVRGVAVSKGTLDVLMEAGWVRYKGRRRTPGRPVTYGTTDTFLEYFALESLDLLPGKSEFQAAGLLDSAIPKDFEIPTARGDEADLDPLESEASEEDVGQFHTDFIDAADDD